MTDTDQQQPQAGEIDLEAIRTRHVDTSSPPDWPVPFCTHCVGDWPCDVAKVLDALDGSIAAEGAAMTIVHELRATVARQAEQIERLQQHLRERGPYCAQHGEHQPCSQHRWAAMLEPGR